MRSACRALQKLVQRVRRCEDWPSRNRREDGEKQRFDYKLPTLFAREIAPAYLAERPQNQRSPVLAPVDHVDHRARRPFPPRPLHCDYVHNSCSVNRHARPVMRRNCKDSVTDMSPDFQARVGEGHQGQRANDLIARWNLSLPSNRFP